MRSDPSTVIVLCSQKVGEEKLNLKLKTM